jgi:transcriptional regulator with XRE-family HTH domain
MKEMNIGEKIRNTREDMDLSQYDMAKMIPMNQSNYSKIERGVQEPSMTQLRRICQILKLDPRYLLDLGIYETVTLEDIKLLNETKAFIKRHQSDE